MTDPLLALALVGSRAPGYNHDCASKLQSIVMALDEIGEIAESLGDPNLTRAAETATASLRELNTLLQANRAMTKTPVRTKTTLRELFAKAGERVSVQISGDVPAQPIEVALPAVIHALAMLLDLAGELTPRGRVATIEAGIVKSAREAPHEVLAVAAFAIARDGGSLVATPAGFAISFA